LCSSIFSIAFTGCFLDGSSSKKKNSASTVTDTFNGAKAVTSADLPVCNSSAIGQLFYVLDVKQFKYCDGTAYQEIDLTGPQGVLAKVYDSNNTELGVLLEAAEDSITLLNSFGFIYHINWGGTIESWANFNFSGIGCTGVMYNQVFGTTYKNISVWNNKLYKPKNIDSNGNAVAVTVSTSSYGYYDITQQCYNTSLPGQMYEVEETTSAAVGIPETITAPIIIK